ncbi:hypothetical protein BC629DRAFT_111852 [Irpex lacteus]|nr:hypothetical protein BC629DRAFT_111852 [Irpex lacteus]
MSSFSQVCSPVVLCVQPCQCSQDPTASSSQDVHARNVVTSGSGACLIPYSAIGVLLPSTTYTSYHNNFGDHTRTHTPRPSCAAVLARTRPRIPCLSFEYPFISYLPAENRRGRFMPPFPVTAFDGRTRAMIFPSFSAKWEPFCSSYPFKFRMLLTFKHPLVSQIFCG